MILNNRFEEPYNKFPNDGPLPLLSKPIIKSKLSKKFWLYSQYLESQNCINSEDEFSSFDNNYNKNSLEKENNNYMNKNNINNESRTNYKINDKKPISSGIKSNNLKKNKINSSKNKYMNLKNDNDEIDKLIFLLYLLNLF